MPKPRNFKAMGLRSYLGLHELSINRLSKESGVSRSTIQGILAGSSATVDTAIKIRRAFPRIPFEALASPEARATIPS